MLYCIYTPSISSSQSFCFLYPPSEAIILITCPRKGNFTLLKKIMCDVCPLAGDNIDTHTKKGRSCICFKEFQEVAEYTAERQGSM